MEHRIIDGWKQSLRWADAGDVGQGFATGRMNDSALPSELLTPTRLLDLVVRQRIDWPQLRCFHGTRPLRREEYLTDKVTRKGHSWSIADADQLTRLVESGMTLVLDGVDTMDPVLDVACRALQWWSGELVQANAYFTTQDTEGFPIHFDDHDVTVMQIAGSKSWEIRGTTRPVPMYQDVVVDNTPPEDTIWTGTLVPGDVMHFPRGYFHRASRAAHGDGLSLHISFGIVKRTSVDWLKWVAGQAPVDQTLREDLRRFGNSAEIQENTAAVTAAARQLLADFPPQAYLEHWAQERRPRRNIGFVRGGDPLDRVVCVANFPPRITTTEEKVTVMSNGRTIEFPPHVAPALSVLLSGHPVRVDDLAAIPDVHTHAATLVRAGVCAVLTPELAKGYAGFVPDASIESLLDTVR